MGGGRIKVVNIKETHMSYTLKNDWLTDKQTDQESSNVKQKTNEVCTGHNGPSNAFYRKDSFN